MSRFGYLLVCVPLALGGCAPGMGVYTQAEVVYAEPAAYVYDAPPDRLVIVTREVLVERGYEVFRVEDDGPNRVIWARHRRGDDEGDEDGGSGEVVRVFVTQNGNRVAVRGLTEVQDRGEGDRGNEDRGDRGDRGRHRGWRKKDRAESLMGEIDRRMRRRREGDDH